MISSETYYQAMYTASPLRDAVWSALARFIQKDIGEDRVVLDLGAGYCSFINQIRARRKLAVDLAAEGRRHAASDVEFFQSPCTELEMVPDASVDAIFASNLLEHLEGEQVTRTLAEARRILRPGGRLLLLQPNFTFAFREYFHDFTHKTIFTHVGLSDLLEASGFAPVRVIPRLVPFSMQSKYGGLGVPKLPGLGLLISLYLRLPWRPGAKQMYLVFRKPE